MSRRVAAALATILPVAAAAETAPPAHPPTKAAPRTGLPEEFAGKLSALMQALYPKWDASAPQERTLAANVSELKGHRVLVVLTQTAESADLSVSELVEGKVHLIAVARGVAKCGDAAPCTLNAGTWHYDKASPLIGLSEESGTGDAAQTVLHLFRINDATLVPVFQRHIRWHGVGACEATVTSDEVDLPPFPLRVVDRCEPSGRTATEIWRWADTSYQLHGPPSDADQPDPTADTDDSEE